MKRKVTSSTQRLSNRNSVVVGDAPKTPGKWYYLACPLYMSDIILYNGEQELSFNGFKRFAKKHNIIDSNGILTMIRNYIGSEDNTSDWYCMDSENPTATQTVVIYTNVTDVTDIDDITSFCHECLHAAMFILNRKGVQDDKCGFEALTYLHGWIFESLLRQIDKELKRKNKVSNNNSKEKKHDNND